ncbi:ATP-binding protein [Mesorhizobium sp. M1142]|uniref:ATP-binding protein n=1 Tax=Mesorhizobium sp. M1142 TaxID=2957060 RepID=UPI00333986A9
MSALPALRSWPGRGLALARLDGRFPRLIDKLTRVQLLILDDFGTHSLTDQQRFHVFKIIEEHYRRKWTLITAQVPVARWHDLPPRSPTPFSTGSSQSSPHQL